MMALTEAAAINRSYGRGLAALRELAGDTQSSLAKKIPFKQTTISEIESGKRSMKAAEIEFFVSYFATVIPGYSEDDCLRVLRQSARNHLRVVRDDATTGNQGDILYFPHTAPEQVIRVLKRTA